MEYGHDVCATGAISCVAFDCGAGIGAVNIVG